ncbi:MAG: hypothetical protein GKS00_28940 [Alphaproteobacteria bacterium]|nr:hypothetical protein [Alphaproteobacteria bacterium]
MKVARLSVPIALLLATACTAPEKTRWTQPGSGTGPKPTDLAACRADANRRAEREFQLETNPRGDRDFASPGDLRTELARRDAKRYRQRIYDECLRSLGYRREQ